ncbi:MAG: deaminase [Ilumatobacter coccineus]|uniref:Deaminase n=1 Tax=Ilumatobacter coccineus TaxID=467094 RepID=A0A2G6K805_9ACTN|nr:MAG: deaminase [Ilumatobacter coccineus]
MTTPLGPYSSVAHAGVFVFTSGQIGMLDGALVPGGVAAQTRQAISNLSAALAAHGVGLDAVVKTTCFLADMDSFSTFNTAYAEGFGESRPARSTVAVKELPAGALVEIEAIAYQER